MSRAKITDLLHNFRYHVVVTGFGPNGDTQLGTLAGDNVHVSAGFSACTAPQVQQENVEYREGHYIYGRKYPGLPTVSEVTLSRGVALIDGTFWAWMKSVIEGNEEYRANVKIYHFHRDSKPQTQSGTGFTTEMPINTTAGALVYDLQNCFPTGYKTSGDLDGTSAEVSISELTLAVESFNQYTI